MASWLGDMPTAAHDPEHLEAFPPADVDDHAGGCELYKGLQGDLLGGGGMPGEGRGGERSGDAAAARRRGQPKSRSAISVRPSFGATTSPPGCFAAINDREEA